MKKHVLVAFGIVLLITFAFGHTAVSEPSKITKDQVFEDMVDRLLMILSSPEKRKQVSVEMKYYLRDKGKREIAESIFPKDSAFLVTIVILSMDKELIIKQKNHELRIIQKPDYFILIPEEPAWYPYPVFNTENQRSFYEKILRLYGRADVYAAHDFRWGILENKNLSKVFEKVKKMFPSD